MFASSLLIELVMFIYLFLCPLAIIFEMAVKILLKNGRCNIQVSKNNMSMSHSSKPHCSSVVTERSPKKKALPHPVILFPSKGMCRLL